MLDFNAEMKPSDRKNFEIDHDKLKKESDTMRYDYYKEMEQCLGGLEECMDLNLTQLKDFFNNFYKIWKNWSEIQQTTINDFKKDVDDLDLDGMYKNYIET